MFIGHFALGYAAKRWAPRLSLAVLFGAAQLADLIWPLLVALGVEQVRIAPGITASTPLEFISYPYSHSLATLLLWGVLLAWLCTRWHRASALSSGSVVLALVLSHWLLDVITHIPDMPIYPGGPKLGFGLWNSVPGTLAVEVIMFAAGVWIYARATSPRDRIGRWALVGLTAFLGVGFVANAASPPPPSVTTIWIGAFVLMAVTLALAHWADSHRTVLTGVRGKG